MWVYQCGVCVCECALLQMGIVYHSACICLYCNIMQLEFFFLPLFLSFVFVIHVLAGDDDYFLLLFCFVFSLVILQSKFSCLPSS